MTENQRKKLTKSKIELEKEQNKFDEDVKEIVNKDYTLS